MSKKLSYAVASLLLGCLILALPGCDFFDIEDDGLFSSAKTGTIEIRITDAPPEYDIATLVIAFSKVEVHKEGEGEQEGGWQDLTIRDYEFDLIELDEKNLKALLAVEEVIPGKYNQLRLVISDISITLKGGAFPPEITLPSGEIRFNSGFTIMDDMTTILLLDFDLDESLVTTGADKIIFKPVVHLSLTQEIT